MKDSELIPLFASVLDRCAAEMAIELGVPMIAVVQKDQPTQQGTASGPTIYFQKLFDVPRGQPKIEYDLTSQSNMREVGTQLYETHFQISALYWQNPMKQENINTASDLINGIQQLLQLPVIRKPLLDMKVRTLRVDQVRNPPFENDDHQFEYIPNFDIVLTHWATRSAHIDSTSDISGTSFPV